MLKFRELGTEAIPYARIVFTFSCVLCPAIIKIIRGKICVFKSSRASSRPVTRRYQKDTIERGLLLDAQMTVDPRNLVCWYFFFFDNLLSIGSSIINDYFEADCRTNEEMKKGQKFHATQFDV